VSLDRAPSHRPSSPEFERRHARMTLPTCPTCSGPSRVVSRTDYVLYVRCDPCLQVWSVPKAGREQLGD
jgi:hypothetical protein